MERRRIVGLEAFKADDSSASHMADPTPSQNLDSERKLLSEALAGQPPYDGLLVLAKQLRDQGLPQDVLTDLFTEFHLKHRDDADEARNDAICEVLDFMSGGVRQVTEFNQKRIKAQN